MRRFLKAGVPLALIAAGGFLVHAGLNPAPEETPDITAPVVAPADQKPAGPVFAEVELEGEGGKKGQMSPDRMKDGTLFIPAAGIYAKIRTDGSYGEIKDGGLRLPPARNVTRWAGGADVKDMEGSLLLAGHISSNGVRGALYDLASLKPGNVAYVRDASGNTQGFQLKEMRSYRKEALPRHVWRTDGPEVLTVVTCGGELHRTSGGWHFDSNIVATFIPVRG